MAAIAAAEANTAVARRRGANGTTFSRSARAVDRIRSRRASGGSAAGAPYASEPAVSWKEASSAWQSEHCARCAS